MIEKVRGHACQATARPVPGDELGDASAVHPAGCRGTGEEIPAAALDHAGAVWVHLVLVPAALPQRHGSQYVVGDPPLARRPLQDLVGRPDEPSADPRQQPAVPACVVGTLGGTRTCFEGPAHPVAVGHPVVRTGSSPGEAPRRTGAPGRRRSGHPAGPARLPAAASRSSHPRAGAGPRAPAPRPRGSRARGAAPGPARRPPAWHPWRAARPPRVAAGAAATAVGPATRAVGRSRGGHGLDRSPTVSARSDPPARRRATWPLGDGSRAGAGPPGPARDDPAGPRRPRAAGAGPRLAPRRCGAADAGRRPGGPRPHGRPAPTRRTTRGAAAPRRPRCRGPPAGRAPR